MARPLQFVVLDELNKYAPRHGSSPIKEILLDVAERGRSLGIILAGVCHTQDSNTHVTTQDVVPAASCGGDRVWVIS